VCKELLFADVREGHRCPPLWTVVEKQYQGDRYEKQFRAKTPSEAAAEYAKFVDAKVHDRPIVDQGEEITVVVIGEDGQEYHFKVCGEMVPSYEAEEIKP